MPAHIAKPSGKLAAAIAAADARDGRPHRRFQVGEVARGLSGQRVQAAASADRPEPGTIVCIIRAEGEPVAWARARQGRADDGAPTFYTHPRQAAQKDLITTLATLAMKGRPPLRGAMGLSVLLWRTIPAGFNKWQRDAAAAGTLRPAVKPDADNFAKLVKDALNRVVWVDDAQVVDLMVRKFYTPGEPCTEITVRAA